jgi:hypothetical protein
MDKSSFADLSTKLGRLDLYLISNGSQLPSDWKSYRSGPLKGHCLFCNSPQAFMSIYQYAVAGTKGTASDTGTLACGKCTSHIRSMEETLPGLEGVPTDLHDVEHIIDSYVFYGVLPKDWYQYMLHNKRGTKRDKCFFCGGGIDLSSPTELTLPVTHSQYITGGRVHVCASCTHMYLGMTNGIAVVKDSCVQCESNYPIDDLEHSYRTHEKTMGQHFCPECTKVLVIDIEKVIPTDEGFLRNNLVECVYCANDVVVDSTLSEALLNDRRRSAKGLVCDECLLELDIANIEYRILDRKPISVKIFEDKVVYAYNLSTDKVLVRTILTNGRGRSYSPTFRKDLINILLKNGR